MCDHRLFSATSTGQNPELRRENDRSGVVPVILETGHTLNSNRLGVGTGRMRSRPPYPVLNRNISRRRGYPGGGFDPKALSGLSRWSMVSTRSGTFFRYDTISASTLTACIYGPIVQCGSPSSLTFDQCWPGRAVYGRSSASQNLRFRSIHLQIAKARRPRASVVCPSCS